MHTVFVKNKGIQGREYILFHLEKNNFEKLQGT